MSNASVTSSQKREAQQDKENADLLQELEAARAMNSTLRTYLQHLRTFKKNLGAVNENFQQLTKVNTQWIDTLNIMK